MYDKVKWMGKSELLFTKTENESGGREFESSEFVKIQFLDQNFMKSPNLIIDFINIHQLHILFL